MNPIGLTEMKRQPPNEPGLVSTRTSASAEADAALISLSQGVALDERQQGYVREMLQSAFADGELQGEVRALWVLTIAEQQAGRSRSRTARTLIQRCIHLLAPELAAWEVDE